MAVGVFSEQEFGMYVGRAGRFGETIDDKSVLEVVEWLMKYSHIFDWEEFVSVLLGVRPSCYPLELEESEGHPSFWDRLPDRLKIGLLVTSAGWIADIELTCKTIATHSKYFSDFDLNRLGDADYLRSYLEKRTFGILGVSVEEKIKAGLLLGFPVDSVIAFALERKSQLQPFKHRGFDFLATGGDAENLLSCLTLIYEESGMNNVLDLIDGRLEEQFADRVAKTEARMRVFEVGGHRYLEVRDVGAGRPLCIKEQLVPLAATEGVDVAIVVNELLEVFAKKYKMMDIQPPVRDSEGNGRVGANYWEYLEILSRILNDGLVPYLEFVEYGNRVERYVYSMTDDELNGFMTQNSGLIENPVELI